MFPQLVGVYIKRVFDSIHGDYIFLVPRFRLEDLREIDGQSIAIGFDNKETLALAGRVAALILDGSYIRSPFVQTSEGRETVVFLKRCSISNVETYLEQRGF